MSLAVQQEEEVIFFYEEGEHIVQQAVLSLVSLRETTLYCKKGVFFL